jgi:hypothetical protein
MHGLHDKETLVQHQLQSKIRECRKKLMTAVRKGAKTSAALEAARLYQLTHSPLPKIKREAKAVGGLKEEGGLPLSELMKLQPPQIKVKLEEEDAGPAVAAASGKGKRKRGSKKQLPQHHGSSDDKDGEAADHGSASTRKVRHSSPYCI